MSSSADDITLFNHAVEDYDSTVLFKDMKFVEVKDSTSTGGNYSSEITFDLNVLQSQADCVSLENTLIQFPVVGQLKTITADSAAPTISGSNFVGAFKNGFHQFVNSATLKVGNKTIAEECQFTNSLVSFKMLSEWNKEGLDKFGKMLGVNKEELDVGASTAGTINNAFDTNFHTTATGIRIANTRAAAERLGWYCIDEAADTSLINIINGDSTVSGVGGGIRKYKGSASASGAVEYEIVAIASIRLCDLIDVVKVMPMLKSCSGSLNLKLNAAKTTITAAATTGVLSYSHEVYRGNTHPGLISTATTSLGGGTGAAVYEWKVEASGNPVLANTPIMKYARMLVASYTPNAQTEAVISQPKAIRYGQWTHYQFDVGAGSTFNENLTSGITNPKRLLLVPVISGAASTGKAVVYDPYTSPFENIGWTTSPCVALSQLNARVGNHSLFNTPIDLSNEYFFSQLQKGISGAREDGMVSGLLTQHDFDTLYRYVPFDLSRRATTEDGSKKSLSVSGKNVSKFQITIHAFYESERAAVVDPSLCVVSEE